MTKSIRNLSIISGVIILFLGIGFLIGQLIHFPSGGNTPNLNNRGDVNASAQETTLDLGNVENAALSTWPGSPNITTLGTISTGSIPESLIIDGSIFPRLAADETISGSRHWIKTLTTDADQAIVFQKINYQLNFSVPNNVWHLGHLARVQTLPGCVSNNQNLILAASGQAKHWGTDVLTGAVAFEGLVANQSTGTIANAVGVTGSIEQNAAGTITVGKLFEGTLGEPFLGTVDTLYGLYLPNINVATTNYAIYSAGGQSYHAGKFGIGTTTPKTKLEVDGIIKTIPRRSAICNADSEGGIYYDSDDKHFYGCNGGSWIRLDNQ